MRIKVDRLKNIAGKTAIYAAFAAVAGFMLLEDDGRVDLNHASPFNPIATAQAAEPVSSAINLSDAKVQNHQRLLTCVGNVLAKHDPEKIVQYSQITEGESVLAYQVSVGATHEEETGPGVSVSINSENVFAVEVRDTDGFTRNSAGLPQIGTRTLTTSLNAAFSPQYSSAATYLGEELKPRLENIVAKLRPCLSHPERAI